MPNTRELGLFIPPEKVAEIEEQEALDREQSRRVTRRLTLRWLGWGAVLALLGQWAIGFANPVGGFFVPKRLGAFGGAITAATTDELKVGDVKMLREGKFYLTRVPEGFMALWWKCPHLGCTVPWKDTEPAMGGPPDDGDLPFAQAGRFHCPCHGSIYNRYGQIIQGPAPRPMDRFPITIQGTKVVVNTGPTVAISRSVASVDDVTKV